MAIQPVQTDKVTEILIESLKDQEWYYKRYALFALEDYECFSEHKKAIWGAKLLEIICNEEDEGISIREYSLLAKFPSEEAAQFLAEQLLKEGEKEKTRRQFAYHALRDMGSEFSEKSLAHVDLHASPEMKKEILKLEEIWEMWQEHK